MTDDRDPSPYPFGDDNSVWPVTPARFVVNEQAGLHDRLAHPSTMLAAWTCGFAKDAASKLNTETGGPPDEAGMMFWPIRAWLNDQWAAKWCAEVAKDLFQARTYQVTADMQDVVTALYEKAHGIFHLEEPMLPSPHGFIWFDKPLMISDRQGKVMSHRAISWGMVTVNGSIKGEPAEPMPAIRLASWTSPEDPDEILDQAPGSRDLMRLIGSLALAHVHVVPFGERHENVNGLIGWKDKPFLTDNMLSWVHHLWMFMDTEVAALKKHPIRNKSSLKRLRKSIKHGEVSVITLRRSRSLGLDGDGWAEPGAIDWSCRWLVQGHERHIEDYHALGFQTHHALRGRPNEDGDPACATCGTRITWIRSHIKGPDDRPLRSSTRLYRVSR